MPYHMKNGKWRAEKIIDGIRKTRTFQTKTEAKKWEASQNKEEWEKSESPIHSICWLEFLNLYLGMASERFCKKTINDKKLAARLSLKVIKPDELPESITPPRALAILSLAAKVSGNAANKVRKDLAAAWNWGVQFHGLPRINPFLECNRFPADSHPRTVPTMAEFQSVYDVADQDDKVFLLFLLHTGARVGEAFRLVWSDVDFENGRLRLGTRKTSNGGMRYDWLPMTRDLELTLKEHKRCHPFSSFVFTQKTNGKPYTSRQHMMGKLCEAANVKPFGFHGIRHLSATMLAYGGIDLPTIQGMLRHSSPTTTARYIKSLGIDRGKIEEVFCDKKSAKVLPFAQGKK